ARSRFGCPKRWDRPFPAPDLKLVMRAELPGRLGDVAQVRGENLCRIAIEMCLGLGRHARPLMSACIFGENARTLRAKGAKEPFCNKRLRGEGVPPPELARKVLRAKLRANTSQ